MSKENTRIILLGKKNSLNTSIKEIVSSSEDYSIGYVPNYTGLLELKYPPEIVILNLIGYPGNAITLIRKLSRKAAYRLIAIHHYSDEIIIKKYKEAGIDYYLGSSFDESELFNVLGKARAKLRIKSETDLLLQKTPRCKGG